MVIFKTNKATSRLLLMTCPKRYGGSKESIRRKWVKLKKFANLPDDVGPYIHMFSLYIMEEHVETHYIYFIT